ncbi:MAG: hypothetical protein ACQEQ4_09870 [Fibrobacterota bacterium]
MKSIFLLCILWVSVSGFDYSWRFRGELQGIYDLNAAENRREHTQAYVLPRAGIRFDTESFRFSVNTAWDALVEGKDLNDRYALLEAGTRFRRSRDVHRHTLDLGHGVYGAREQSTAENNFSDDYQIGLDISNLTYEYRWRKNQFSTAVELDFEYHYYGQSNDDENEQNERNCGEITIEPIVSYRFAKNKAAFQVERIDFSISLRERYARNNKYDRTRYAVDIESEGRAGYFSWEVDSRLFRRLYNDTYRDDVTGEENQMEYIAWRIEPELSWEFKKYFETGVFAHLESRYSDHVKRDFDNHRFGIYLRYTRKVQ